MQISEIKLGLSRIKMFLKLLDNPQKNLKVVHVAGTNGKGSTINFLEGIAIRQGVNCGTYTSPYLFSVLENIRVKGVEITKTEMLEWLAISSNAKHITEKHEGKLTEFELHTAMALWHFDKKKCDIVFLETGLGGELDATCVADNRNIFAFTNISVDHIEYFGNTAIGNAKSEFGIITKNSMVFSAFQEKQVAELLAKECQEKDSTIEFSEFEYKGKIKSNSSFSPLNAALAASVAKYLGYSDAAIKEGIEKTNDLSGRFYKIKSNPTVIFDVAHNVAGIKELLKSLKKNYKDKEIVFIAGICKDKQIDEMLELLSTVSNTIAVVDDVEIERLVEGRYLAPIAKKYFDNVTTILPWDASKFVTSLDKNAVVVVCGSFLMRETAFEIEHARVSSILINIDFRKLNSKIIKNEMDRKFCKHDVTHAYEVFSMAQKLNIRNNLGFDKDVVFAAAMLHDIGRAEEAKNHAIASSKLAVPILEKAGYDSFEIKQIIKAIKHHSKKLEKNSDPLADLLFEADKKSRDCESCKAKSKCKNHQQTRI